METASARERSRELDRRLREKLGLPPIESAAEIATAPKSRRGHIGATWERKVQAKPRRAEPINRRKRGASHRGGKGQYE